MAEKQSPLKKLVSAHEESLPVKVVPKQRVITPIVEDGVVGITPVEGNQDASQKNSMAIMNSSLTLNFNFNLDSKAMDKAVEQSARVAKGLAAGAMAMLGTAFIFGGDKKGKVKIPRSKKVRVPKVD